LLRSRNETGAKPSLSADQFLSDLGRSEMIHIVDQYTGRTDNNRYAVSRSGLVVSSRERGRG
jgi:hypothetical protein